MTFNCNSKKIIKLAEVVNTQITEIETTILQASSNHKTQIVKDIFSILEDLQNIIQSDIESQAYYIQALLVNELDNCKKKENMHADEHIKEIQDTYIQEDWEIEKLIIVDKGKQWDNQI